MKNGISYGIKCITVLAWHWPAASITRQFASLPRPQCAASEAVRLSSSALHRLTVQKYSPLRLVFISLAAAGVPAALSMLPVFKLAPCSHCQPIHNPTGTLDFVPAAVWPRLQFYLRVAMRMVVLLSILSPLAILYPVSCLHPRARTLWLGLLQLSLRWCGPAFTKWAQWASARGDLLPPDVRAVLETLQNAAPAQSRADTMRTLQRSLSMPLDEVFAYIDMEPAGCGAIAQVHRAGLTPKAAAMCGVSPDQEVALKVKKRGVESTLQTDFLIMQMLARLLSRVPVLRDLRFDDSMRQFGVPLHQQLDFKLEAQNLSQFAANFRNTSGVLFPRPLWPFVSHDLLMETFIPGHIVRHYVSSDNPLNPSIAKIGLSAYLQMMLVDNWQHADLHPGNIIVLEQPVMSMPGLVAQAAERLSTWMGYKLPMWSSNNLKLAIIDVGMTVSLQRPHYLALVQLYDGIAALDGPTIGKAMVQLRYKETRVGELDLAAFRSDIEGIFRDVDRQQFRDQTQEVCGCVLEAMRRHKITMDAAAITVLLTTLALEGWATKLDPDIRILERICELIPRAFVHRIPTVVDRLLYADVLQLE